MNGIYISPYGCSSQFDNYNKDADLTELESQALEYIKIAFTNLNIDFNELRFRRRSDSYLTILAPNDIDFCRLKVSERSTWFSVHGMHLSEPLKSDPRFNGAKKNTLHWKVKLNDVTDFINNSDLIVQSYLSLK